MTRFTKEPEMVSTGYEPHNLQYEIHRHLKRFSVLVCHRRFGKTVLAVNTLIDAAARFDVSRADRVDPRFAYLAPFRNQAKDITWQYFQRFAARFPGVEFNQSELTVRFPHNNAVIKLYGADNADAMRGLYFDGIVVDEVADMESNVWSEILRPCVLDRHGWCLFIGTPKGINLFSQLYFAALDKPDWYAGIYPASKSLGVLPWITQKELDAAREDMTDAKYRQEFMCDFGAASDNVLITMDLYRECTKRQPDKSIYTMEPMILMVDVARFGGDSSVIGRRQGFAGFPTERFTKIDNMELADQVAARIERYNAEHIFVDGGRGEGVIDRLRRLGYNIHEVNSQSTASDTSKYMNKRAEMYDRLRKWMEDGGALPYCPRLEAQITAARYDFNSKGQMFLEPKKDIKDRIGMSPDEADDFALGFAQTIKPRLNRSPSSRSTHRKEYSIFGRRR